MKNVDSKVASGFGHEWSTFRQGEKELTPDERERLFLEYFHIFPWASLPPDPVGLDAGCGSGRWSMMVASRVGHLHLLDASADALAVARKNLAFARNVSFHHASVSEIPLEDGSLDFAFSLGVLHHVPDTVAAIRSISAKLKPGAPFLIYLYYALDNRPWWYRGVWQVTNAARWLISKLPPALKLVASEVIAATIYWPLAKIALLVHRAGYSAASIPLEAYKDRSFYTMRTDAYDRFCTSLEKRFSRSEIESMLSSAGFEGISFSEVVPFWCAVGYKRA